MNRSNSKPVIPRRQGLALLAGCAIFLALPCGAYAKSKWEYRVVNANMLNRQLENLLNTNGAQGWELVQINSAGVAIFKRRK